MSVRCDCKRTMVRISWVRSEQRPATTWRIEKRKWHMNGLRGIALLAARVILGFIFIMHGWQKLHTNGIDATTAFFKSVNVPWPEFSAYYAAWVELVGGILLILGLLLPLVSILLVIDMIGAIATVHWDHGFWSNDGGYEFPLALIAALLAVGFANAGHFAADSYVFRRRRGGRAVEV